MVNIRNVISYKHKLLSAAQLKRLSDHKYSCTNVSLLDPILQPWWCFLVSKTPLWLAPNLITTVGLIVNVLTTLILIFFSPNGKEVPPQWACALCALGLFIYQSLDAIDGKQARRTNSSTPLGELFDHGCDSISTVFVALSACISVRLGFYPKWLFFQCFCAMILFYCAHWQTYVSGTLRFGRIDVTEAQCTIIGIHVISAIFGPDIWMTKICQEFQFWMMCSVMTVVCGMWSLSHVFKVIHLGGVGKNGSTVAIPILGNCNLIPCALFFFGYFQVFIGFIKIFVDGGVGKNGSTVAMPWGNMDFKTFPLYFAVVISGYLTFEYLSVIFTGGVGKNGSTVAGTSVISPVIPLFSVVIPAFIISEKSIDNIFENHPALYILTFGMVAAKITNKLVIAHMTKSEMDYVDWGLLGPAMLFFNQYFSNFLPEIWVLWIALIWCTFDLTRYCSQVCLEICDHLNIQLFRIPYPPPKLTQYNSQSTNASSIPFSTNSGNDRNGTSGSSSSSNKRQTRATKRSVH